MPDPSTDRNSCEVQCFLSERRFLRTVSLNLREALNAEAGVSSDHEYWCVREPLDYDDDLEEATTLAMLGQLSGAEAEILARAIRCVGAPSAADVVRDLRVAYAACVREHHAAGRSQAKEDFLCDLALQLVDPIRRLTTPASAFATVKLLVELLSYVEIEIDTWVPVLWIRVLHPGSRLGAPTALRGLVADFKARGGGATKPHGGGTLALESHEDLRSRLRRPGETGSQG